MVSDRIYRRIYERVIEQRYISFQLLSSTQFQQFGTHNVPALRLVMD